MAELLSYRARVGLRGGFELLPSPRAAALALSRMPDPETVRRMERAILELPQVDLQTRHLVHGGMYARTILVPAGCALTGALTNAANVCIVSGDITVTTDDGPRRLRGYHVLPAQPGFKRAGIAHADTYWTTLVATELTDVTEIENAFTDEAELLQTRRPGIVYERPRALERDDYARFLAEFGFSEEMVRHVVADMSDHAELPAWCTKLTIGPSQIEGRGTFAAADIAEGEVIAPARLNDCRTHAGRLTNHSPLPNCRFEARASGDLLMVARRAIPAGEELTVDYRQAAAVNGFIHERHAALEG
jgi:hypothetical protein